MSARRHGALTNSSAPLLLASASLMDFVLALALAAIIEPFAAPYLRQLDLPANLNQMVLAIGLIVLGWVVSEFVLGGLTFGRFVLGLQPRDKAGQVLPAKTKLRRATGKLVCLGLTGANPFRPARYDAKAGVVWHSPIAPAPAGPLQEWRLMFRGGTLKGKSSRLGAIPSFKSRKEIRFGRAKGWADVKLGDDDRAVSGQHCVLFVSGGKLYLRDGNGSGKGSSSGTRLDGKPLDPARPRLVSAGSSFEIADIKVDVSG